MKKFLCVLLVIMLSLVCVSALAQSNTVSAIGTATISLEPDIASFSVGITTQDTLVTTAQTANAAAMQTVLNALTAQGVSQDDLQTDSYSVYPVYSYETDTPTVTGYEISNTVTVIVRNVDQLPSLLDAAVEAGANNVYSLGFQSSETTSAYDQALKAAAQDALRKASMMAQAIGRSSAPRSRWRSCPPRAIPTPPAAPTRWIPLMPPPSKPVWSRYPRRYWLWLS